MFGFYLLECICALFGGSECSPGLPNIPRMISEYWCIRPPKMLPNVVFLSCLLIQVLWRFLMLGFYLLECVPALFGDSECLVDLPNIPMIIECLPYARGPRLQLKIDGIKVNNR